MGTPLGPKYIPHTCMDPLGILCFWSVGGSYWVGIRESKVVCWQIHLQSTRVAAEGSGKKISSRRQIEGE